LLHVHKNKDARGKKQPSDTQPFPVRPKIIEFIRGGASVGDSRYVPLA
jgi:hypothetical protein